MCPSCLHKPHFLLVVGRLFALFDTFPPPLERFAVDGPADDDGAKPHPPADEECGGRPPLVVRALEFGGSGTSAHLKKLHGFVGLPHLKNGRPWLAPSFRTTRLRWGRGDIRKLSRPTLQSTHSPNRVYIAGGTLLGRHILHIPSLIIVRATIRSTGGIGAAAATGQIPASSGGDISPILGIQVISTMIGMRVLRRGSIHQHCVGVSRLRSTGVFHSRPWRSVGIISPIRRCRTLGSDSGCGTCDWRAIGIGRGQSDVQDLPQVPVT